MTSPRTDKEPFVWIIPATVTGNDPVFPWNWNGFYREPRLSVLQSTRTKNASGTATFQLLRLTQYPPGGPDFQRQVSSFRVGCYVLVTTNSVTDITDPDNPVERPDIDEVEWFGVITETDFQIVDVGEYSGSCSAAEVGDAILDCQRIEGFRQASGTPGTTYEMTSPPPANLNGNGSKVIGNAIADLDDSGNPAYVFAKDLSDCGNDPIATPSKFWTRWRLLTHVAQFCAPIGIAPIVVRLEDESGVVGTNYVFTGHASTSLAAYLDSTIAPECLSLDGLTLRGAIDMIAGSGVGLGWRLDPAYIGGVYVWQITVFSRSELNSTYGPPKREPSPSARILSISYVASDGQTKDIQFSEDDSSRYDEVVVQGGNIVFGATLSKLDGNLDQAWNYDQEVAYLNATGAKRDSPAFADVYRSFVISGLTRATNPGLNDTALPLVPRVTWSWNATAKTGTASVSPIVSAHPYLPALRLRSDVPWQDGLDPETGLNAAGNAVLASPSYMRPAVFIHDVTFTTFPWIDILSRTVASTFTPISESPSVDVEERRPGINVSYSRPHILGLNTFVSTDNGGQDPAYDWRTMLVTVGIPSDQKVEIRRLRQINGANIASNRIRRTLLVRDDGLNFWCCLGGTVVGTNSTNSSPLRVGVDTFVVNDYAAAQLYCDQLAEWAFRPHESVVIQHVNDGSTIGRWKIGMSLYQVSDGQTSRHISGVIASLETDWMAGIITLRTELPPQPTRMGGGQSASPSSGGNVSAELGGTLAQVVQQQGAQQQRISARASAAPIIPAVVSSPPPSRLWLVVGGNTLAYVAGPGIARRLDAVAASELPDGAAGTGIIVVPPSPAAVGLPDGFGVAQRYDGTDYTWVLLDSTTTGAVPDLLGNNDVILAAGTGTLDKVSGATTWRYNYIRPVAGWW